MPPLQVLDLSFNLISSKAAVQQLRSLRSRPQLVLAGNPVARQLGAEARAQRGAEKRRCSQAGGHLPLPTAVYNVEEVQRLAIAQQAVQANLAAAAMAAEAGSAVQLEPGSQAVEGTWKEQVELPGGQDASSLGGAASAGGAASCSVAEESRVDHVPQDLLASIASDVAAEGGCAEGEQPDQWEEGPEEEADSGSAASYPLRAGLSCSSWSSSAPAHLDTGEETGTGSGAGEGVQLLPLGWSESCSWGSSAGEEAARAQGCLALRGLYLLDHSFAYLQLGHSKVCHHTPGWWCRHF